MSGGCSEGTFACGNSCLPMGRACGGPAALSLSVSRGTLSPAFDSQTTMYTVQVWPWVDTVQVTATAASEATIEINGATVVSGMSSAPIPVVPGVTTIDVSVRDLEAAARSYRLVVMRSQALPDYLKAGNSGANDYFGASVSLFGDTLAVGANQEDSSAVGIDGNGADNSAVNSGAVYVFRRSGDSWVQEAYLKSGNSGARDFFGASVSLSGDTLAVGAPAEASMATGVNGNGGDNSAAESGAVYIFQRTGVTWVQQAYLKASNTDTKDFFGASVSLSGNTLAVGAPYEDSNATGVDGNAADDSVMDSGAVYIFQRTGATWAQQAYLKASNTELGDQFGNNVSLSGDTVAVSAFQEWSSATGINGDGSDNGALQSGAVYVFQRSGAVWAQQAYIKASNTGASDQFGWSLALFGDTLAVGSNGEDSSATGVNGDGGNDGTPESGAVYVFQRTGATWAQQAYIKASNTDAYDSFGSSVSVSGDTLAIGAYTEDSSATGLGGNAADNSAANSGAVYVFQRTGASWAQKAYVKARNTDATDLFGASVSLFGDVLAIGAYGEASNATGVNGNAADNSAMVSGAVYVFR